MNPNDPLDEARLALRSGFFREALALLEGAECASDPAARLNLLGLAHEGCGEFHAARRCFGRAIRADPHCQAAEQNLRRLYELETFGRTWQSVAFGNEPAALAALLRARGTHCAGDRMLPAGAAHSGRMSGWL